MPNYYIFKASDLTYKECIEKMLVGQRETNQYTPVNNVKIGDVIFIHKTSTMNNIQSQFIEGPFFAISDGSENIDPSAWNGNFPWQVRIEKRGDTSKIGQDSFKNFLNYSLDVRFFKFQIETITGKKLLQELGLEYDVIENAATYNPIDNIDIDIRLRYPTKYRCNDGHYVRSKNEVIVDNWLYNNNITHAYEKKLLGINILCDFQIKNKNNKEVYIEIWGLTDNTYLKRKKEKEEIYKKNNLTLISITEKEIQNIDDFLNEKLKKLNCI